MVRKNINAPEDEQTICVNCGFCCDGTLYRHAVLDPGEKGHLPEKIGQSLFTADEKDYFWLPCHYFSEKCTIYDLKRANVCSSYRCQLLKDYTGKKISMNDALRIVREACNMRRELMEQYKKVTGNDSQICFRQLLLELGKIQRAGSEKEPLKPDFDILRGRCNIFEALLIKHIRSSEDFESMMAGKQDKCQ
jgi:hypothetical protein